MQGKRGSVVFILILSSITANIDVNLTHVFNSQLLETYNCNALGVGPGICLSL